MEQLVKQLGRALLYGIAAIFIMTLITDTYKIGGALYEAVQNFMEGICGG